MAKYDYSPFGETLTQAGEMAEEFSFRFSTKYWDKEISLYNYGFRPCSPSQGGWINRDPIGEKGGINLYVFTRNNGINEIDYLGYSTIGWDGKINVTLPLNPEINISFIVFNEGDIFDENILNDDIIGDKIGRGGNSVNDIYMTECEYCGPEIGNMLIATINKVKTEFENLQISDPKKAKNRCSYIRLAQKWDISMQGMGLPYHADFDIGCGQKGTCANTLMVHGNCYDVWEINYVLFGLISKLCEFTNNEMDNLIWAHKLRKNPSQYTPQVIGWAKAGYTFNGNLAYPPVKEIHSKCELCPTKNIYTIQNNLGTPFSTTWPIDDINRSR